MTSTILGRKVLGAAGRSFAFAGLSAGLVAVRILQQGEGFQPRTLLLLATVAVGAGLAGAAVFSVAAVFAKRWPAALRGVVASPLLLGSFIGIAVPIFALLRAMADVEFDPEDRHAFAWLGLVEDSLGLFVTAGVRYWLPWPLPLIGLMGGLLAALPFRPRAQLAPGVDALAAPAR